MIPTFENSAPISSSYFSVSMSFMSLVSFLITSEIINNSSDSMAATSTCAFAPTRTTLAQEGPALSTIWFLSLVLCGVALHASSPSSLFPLFNSILSNSSRPAFYPRTASRCRPLLKPPPGDGSSCSGCFARWNNGSAVDSSRKMVSHSWVRAGPTVPPPTPRNVALPPSPPTSPQWSPSFKFSPLHHRQYDSANTPSGRRSASHRAANERKEARERERRAAIAFLKGRTAERVACDGTDADAGRGSGNGAGGYGWHSGRSGGGWRAAVGCRRRGRPKAASREFTVSYPREHYVRRAPIPLLFFLFIFSCL
ncbi:hypothetical protein C8R45DRAFT_45885 [Mycena sanguinolenta]|nr:hypothetical protein C8R45DRAFT_45885 [Mycena sanguinolenta]